MCTYITRWYSTWTNNNCDARSAESTQLYTIITLFQFAFCIDTVHLSTNTIWPISCIYFEYHQQVSYATFNISIIIFPMYLFIYLFSLWFVCIHLRVKGKNLNLMRLNVFDKFPWFPDRWLHGKLFCRGLDHVNYGSLYKDNACTAAQKQIAVTVYLSSLKLLLFGIAEQWRWITLHYVIHVGHIQLVHDSAH